MGLGNSSDREANVFSGDEALRVLLSVHQQDVVERRNLIVPLTSPCYETIELRRTERNLLT